MYKKEDAEATERRKARVEGRGTAQLCILGTTSEATYAFAQMAAQVLLAAKFVRSSLDGLVYSTGAAVYQPVL